jgi:hypothetical protein
MLVGPVVGTKANIDFEKFHRLYPSLADDVRRYDPELIIYHDSAVARYGIARRTSQGIRFITLWQDDDGNPRPMDSRLLAALASWDLRPTILRAARTADEEADRRDAADNARRERQNRTLDDDISHLTRSNRRQLLKAFAKDMNVP